jgi:hypothetical protein
MMKICLLKEAVENEAVVAKGVVKSAAVVKSVQQRSEVVVKNEEAVKDVKYNTNIQNLFSIILH